ncbi:MAG: hypothetical protein V3U11_01525 [Planctomycetota bacterium]
MPFPRAVLVGALLTLPSCYEINYGVVNRFALACDGEGDTYHPESGTKILDNDKRSQLILREVDKEFDRQEKELGRKLDVRRILIHVHGGLNSGGTSLETASKVFARMSKEKPNSPDSHVPIFVTWDSGLYRSYGEHLVQLRHGRHQKVWGWITSPLYFASDVVTGVARTPRSWSLKFASDTGLGVKVGFGYNLLPSWESAEAVYDTLKASTTGKLIRANLGSYERGVLNQGSRFVVYLATLLPSMVLTAVALDGVGQGAWEGMLHRASNLFHKYSQFNLKRHKIKEEDLLQEPGGAFAVFVRELIKHLEKRSTDDPDTKYEITLVGHSMGAIILNDALRDLVHKEKERNKESLLPITHIVYMAAASSVAETVQSVVPYLEAHRKTEFHVLTLHPLAEVDERNYYDLAPRGSLLEWIDNWYTHPTSPLERRFGKWTNLMQVLHLFHSVTKQVTIKGFEVADGTIPQKHGDFSSCPFWRKDFWYPQGTMKYPANWQNLEGQGKRFDSAPRVPKTQ